MQGQGVWLKLLYTLWSSEGAPDHLNGGLALVVQNA